MNQKILAIDPYTLNISREERTALTVLQDTIPKLTRSEKLTVVILLTNSVSISYRCLSLVSAPPGFSQDLTTVGLQIPSLSLKIQLAIAIELLEGEREERDE